MQEHNTQFSSKDKKPDDKPGKDKNVINLIFVVNGTPFTLEANIHWRLNKAVETVLKKTGNEGRKAEDWTVNWNGKQLDTNKKIEEFNFPDNAELFLSLNAGQGGSSKVSEHAGN